MVKAIGHGCVVLVAVLTLCLTPIGTQQRAHASLQNTSCVKRITISLARERLRAWCGQSVVLVSPVTTGNSTLPTPAGYFRVFAKRSPYTFISPWPKGNSKWYPTSKVSYAMEFLGGGYFIHDAPWRGVYGKGTNSSGPPGTNYGGTHGCVNIPFWAAHFLYYWAPMGISVHIVR